MRQEKEQISFNDRGFAESKHKKRALSCFLFAREKGRKGRPLCGCNPWPPLVYLVSICAPLSA